MKYYILNNEIKASDTLPNNEFYNFVELTASQRNFYLSNPSASVAEVLAEAMNPPPPPVEAEPPVPKLEERVADAESKLELLSRATEDLIDDAIKAGKITIPEGFMLRGNKK